MSALSVETAAGQSKPAQACLDLDLSPHSDFSQDSITRHVAGTEEIATWVIYYPQVRQRRKELE